MEKRTVFPVIASSEIYSTWRDTLERRDLGFSRHFQLAIIANLLAYFGLASLYKRFHGDPQAEPYPIVFTLLGVLFINYLGYYMVVVFRHVRRQLLLTDCDERRADDLLFVSYLAFRLYFVGLMVCFILMTLASTIPRT